MEQDLNHLLHTDINNAQACLKKILEEMSKSVVSQELIEEGLRASHTLKALAAIRNMAHLEEYAAQLEQMFVYAKQLKPDEVYDHLNSKIKVIQKEFRAACSLVEEESQKLPVSRKLAQAVEVLHQLDQKYRHETFNRHIQQLGKNDISIEALFKSFVPWIRRAAETSQKEIMVEFHIPTPVALQTKALSPLQTMLVHVLRNAVFHGIEHPSARKALGKSPTGTISLKAEIEDDLLTIAISDDGRGISCSASLPEAKIDTALPLAFLQKEMFDNEHKSNTALTTSIYSVSNNNTGLGVGLHIVRTHLQKLEGEFELKSIPNKGTSAIIRIPLKAFQNKRK